MNKLDEPLSGAVTLPARLLLPTESRGALQNGFLAFVAGDATVTAALVRPLDSITHVGYVMDDTLVDFSEFPIRAQER